MGDEGHNRNKAGTSLFIREILADVYKTHFSLEQQQEAIGFINGNDHAFLNLSMPSCKATMDPTLGIPYSTLFQLCVEMVLNLVSAFQDWEQISGLPLLLSISGAYISQDILRQSKPGYRRQLYYGNNGYRRFLYGSITGHCTVRRRPGTGCY